VLVRGLNGIIMADRTVGEEAGRFELLGKVVEGNADVD
jgi:hypothetical protein